MSLATNLSTTAWWSHYYSQCHESYRDWYLPNEVVLQEIQTVMKEYDLSPQECHVLQSGCGSSELTSLLYNSGYHHIENIDFVPEVIEQMKTLHQHLNGVTYTCMDVRQLTFPNDTFDLIIDKGTFDCVVLDDKLDIFDSQHSIHRMLSEMYRVLKCNGIYLFFSLYSDMERLHILNYNKEQEWEIEYKEMECSPLELPNQTHTYMYVCTKKKKKKEEQQPPASSSVVTIHTTPTIINTTTLTHHENGHDKEGSGSDNIAPYPSQPTASSASPSSSSSSASSSASPSAISTAPQHADSKSIFFSSSSPASPPPPTSHHPHPLNITSIHVQSSSPSAPPSANTAPPALPPADLPPPRHNLFVTFLHILYHFVFERFIVGIGFFRWCLLIIPLAALIGTACALFLYCIDRVTLWRWEDPWLLYLLPLFGLSQGLMYFLWGSSVNGGVNLIIEQIHIPNHKRGHVFVPIRMAPMVFIGTILTHFGGGSAGREGTALQMAGSLCTLYYVTLQWCTHSWITLSTTQIRTITIASLAAGFGGVFGTPLAGTLFALEVLYIGRIQLDMIIPSMIASITSDCICRQWLHLFSLHHTLYTPVSYPTTMSIVILLQVITAAICFGLVAIAFAEAIEGIKHGCARISYLKKYPFIIPILGGVIIIALRFIFQDADYLGIGTIADPAKAVYETVIIPTCFIPQGAKWYSFILKWLFTVVTLGTGYKGGEVTCLFFIGAALGNTCARVFGTVDTTWSMVTPMIIGNSTAIDLTTPPMAVAVSGIADSTSFFAALGFTSVFGAITNTPLASTLMAVELFGCSGAQALIYIAVSCFIAYIVTGFSGIYGTQRLHQYKMAGVHDRNEAVQEEAAWSATKLHETQFISLYRRDQDVIAQQQQLRTDL